MRYLGIDYGSKRIGLALSDPSGTMAFPHAVIGNNAKTLATLEALIANEGVKAIVIGHSLDKSGQPNAIHAAVEELMTDLTLACGLPIHLEPEYFSTQEALRPAGRHATIDASAAAIILNSYLQRQTI
jgi:putative Holliday junction resolvase